MKVKLLTDLTSYNPKFTRDAVGESNMHEYQREGQPWRTYVNVRIEGDMLPVGVDGVECLDNDYIRLKALQKKSEEKEKILISYGASMNHPINYRYVERDMLLESMDNWRAISNRNESWDMLQKRVTFNDLFEIKRGVATGANSYFVMTREKATRLQIPDIALKPLIPKARYLKSLVIEKTEDGYPDVDPQWVIIDCDLD